MTGKPKIVSGVRLVRERKSQRSGVSAKLLRIAACQSLCRSATGSDARVSSVEQADTVPVLAALWTVVE